MSGCGANSATISEVGETGVLALVQRFCPAAVVGDDGAAIRAPRGDRLLVVTTDVLVDGVHFSDRTTSSEDAGWRAAAANLSDLAAMGAQPLGITVGLGASGETPLAWVEGLYRGLDACLRAYETPLLGGDLCRSPTISVAVTAFGEVAPARVLRRSAARVGDAIVATGWHGSSRAGLEVLWHPERGESLSASERERLVRSHRRPRPRLDVLDALWQCSDRAAGMDSSDGLADAIVQLCRASGVGAEVDAGAVAIDAAIARWVGSQQALEWALYGGEDFELVLCLPWEAARALVAQLGAGAAIVGEITPGEEIFLHTLQGERIALSQARGFQHF